MPKHGVELMKRCNSLGNHFRTYLQLLGQVCLRFFIMRNKLVKWWIKQPDSCRTSFKRLEDPLKVFPLIRQKLFQSGTANIFTLGKNHFTHRVNTITLKEHMLGSGKTYSFCTKGNSLTHLFWCVCVCSQAKFSVLIC